MALPGEQSLSHNIVGFSWPVGLGINSSTSQAVFVELYSVVHRSKRKGDLGLFVKSEIIEYGF